jgi:serine/threonine-protein kinase
VAREPLVGDRVGGFEILEPLGRGGFATVYRALQIRLDRVVALKILDPAIARDPDAARRFEREGWAAAGLDHPAIVPVYEADEDDGLLYLAMRLVDGRPLSAEIVEGRWPRERVQGLATTIGDALDHAHERGVLHRDVKPANILVEGERVWLADFGIAVLARSTGRYTVGTLGTAHYMSPEQVRGDEVSAASDLYSFGCVIFECLTGETPYAGADMASAMYAHVHEPIPSAGDAALDTFFERALAKDPADRYSSGHELARALSDALGGTTAAPARTVTAPTEPAPTLARSRRRRVVGAIAVVAVAAGVVAGALLGGGGGGTSPRLAVGVRGPVDIVDPAGARYKLPAGWAVADVQTSGGDRNTAIRTPQATVLIGSRAGRNEMAADLAASTEAGDFRCPVDKQQTVRFGGVAAVRCTFVPANQQARPGDEVVLYYANVAGQSWITRIQPTDNGTSKGSDVDRFVNSVRLGPAQKA